MADKEKKELVLLNKYGLHVRPAGLFAKIASRFDAEVEVEKDGNVVSGKSIMALMTLEAVCGTKLVVTASGPQAKQVLRSVQPEYPKLLRFALRSFGMPNQTDP